MFLLNSLTNALFRTISGFTRCFSRWRRADLPFAARNNDFLKLNFFGPFKFQENFLYDEKNSPKIALLPIASKFGPQEVYRFSQLCALFHPLGSFELHATIFQNVRKWRRYVRCVCDFFCDEWKLVWPNFNQIQVKQVLLKDSGGYQAKQTRKSM